VSIVDRMAVMGRFSFCSFCFRDSLPLVAAAAFRSPAARGRALRVQSVVSAKVASSTSNLGLSRPKRASNKIRAPSPRGCSRRARPRRPSGLPRRAEGDRSIARRAAMNSARRPLRTARATVGSARRLMLHERQDARHSCGTRERRPDLPASMRARGSGADVRRQRRNELVKERGGDPRARALPSSRSTYKNDPTRDPRFFRNVDDARLENALRFEDPPRGRYELSPCALGAPGERLSCR